MIDEVKEYYDKAAETEWTIVSFRSTGMQQSIYIL